MAEIKNNFSLAGLNTFGISAKADYYTEITSGADIEELTDKNIFQSNSRLIIGGGSNLLFTQDYPGLVIHARIKGLELIEENHKEILIRVGSGYVWDEFVKYAVSKNYGGLENLSGIPGNVGASPVQNIGAYGVEVSELIERVEGYDLDEKKWFNYAKEDCGFGYRNSIFKEVYKNTALVCKVTFRLTKNPLNFITHYGSLNEEFNKGEKNLQSMREIIMNIRNSKLPDVKDVGNAGSFFKNPVVNAGTAEELKKSFPKIPVYPTDNNMVKLSAAWLIDQAGLKGCQLGNAATHEKQALVIVNKGGASGKEIIELADLIKDSVMLLFRVKLEPEVNII